MTYLHRNRRAIFIATEYRTSYLTVHCFFVIRRNKRNKCSDRSHIFYGDDMMLMIDKDKNLLIMFLPLSEADLCKR